MDLEDFAESEVAVAMAVTGLILSPKIRGVLRRGAVLGLSELLKGRQALAATPFKVGTSKGDDGLEDIVSQPGEKGSIE